MKLTACTTTCKLMPISFRTSFPSKRSSRIVSIRSSSDESDCNTEECAPEKEVGKMSIEWLAEEKTKVVGTFPPRTRGWTGYVEKDTAGQTNIYSVEPTVYISDSAISSGAAGSSSEGSENTVTLAGGIALVCVVAASSILFLVNKNSPEVPTTTEYTGPALSYYIDKFAPAQIVEAAAPSVSEEVPILSDVPEGTVEKQVSAPENSPVEVEVDVQDVVPLSSG